MALLCFNDGSPEKHLHATQRKKSIVRAAVLVNESVF